MQKALAIELLDVRAYVKRKDYDGEPIGCLSTFAITGYDLEAEPQGANLLAFRIGYKSDDDDSDLTLRDYTYSGRYVVHWAEED